MPVIKVDVWEGRSVEQKRRLVEALTRETSEIMGCAPESIYIIIEDVKKENWGAGGQLCSDKYPD